MRQPPEKVINREAMVTPVCLDGYVAFARERANALMPQDAGFMDLSGPSHAHMLKRFDTGQRAHFAEHLRVIALLFALSGVQQSIRSGDPDEPWYFSCTA